MGDQVLTPHDVLDIVSTVNSILDAVQQYIHEVQSVAVDPAAFLQLPLKQEQLQNLIDAFAALYDALPWEIFESHMNEMLVYRDQLEDLENRAASRGDLPPLFSLEWELSERGCARLAIPRDFVECLVYEAGLTNPEIASLLGCGLRTLETRLREWGIRRREATLTDQELLQLIQSWKDQLGLFHGERAIAAMLHANGHWAPRQRIREAIRSVDPEGLIRWKIVIHGGIDGKTRLVVFLRASDNNRAETVGTAFEEATKAWGWPSRVRADWGGENMTVKAMMEQVRGAGRASFLAGPSTHNQRIEQQRILDTTNEVHLWALHLVFLPRINKALQIFTDTWNNHKLSSQGNKTPKQLYYRGQIEARQLGFWLDPGLCPVLDDGNAAVQAAGLQDFTQYGADLVGAQRERRADDPHVLCEPPAQSFLSMDEATWILNQIQVVDDEEDFYGTERYRQVLDLISQVHPDV
ncbi:hypothetical protein FS837_009922 [Tulasnella sp. UAMH 9824]|nr:hypothetical protein FS837_009922 [Tulasnella sp. UAMH 9824]